MGGCYKSHRRKSHRQKHSSTRKVKRGGKSKRFEAKRGGTFQTPTGSAPASHTAPLAPEKPEDPNRKKSVAPSPGSGNILKRVGDVGSGAVRNLSNLFASMAGGRKKTKHRKHGKKRFNNHTKKHKKHHKKHKKHHKKHKKHHKKRGKKH